MKPRGNIKCFDELKGYIDELTVIDTHDHSAGYGPDADDAIEFIISGYFRCDVRSASNDKTVELLIDKNVPLEKRWPVFEKIWNRTKYTGYGLVTRLMLKRFYGLDDLTFDGIKKIQETNLQLSDPKISESILDEMKIEVRLANIACDIEKIINKTYKLPARARLVIGLPAYHSIKSYSEIQAIAKPLGKIVTSLDEYVVICKEIFTAYRDFGAVAFKDQSAYQRKIDYSNPTKSQAEEIFNWIMANPRRVANYPEQTKPLDDWLFHQFMRIAREFDLPVQIHTGILTWNYNDIRNANAINLRSLIELHKDVRFDIFHANWPYAEELIYLGKNYPNVYIDFCWANIIDPVYCQRMFKQILSAVPHGKIHGYGSDYEGQWLAQAWAHLKIAKDNIAIALAEMIDMQYIDIGDAKEIAKNWLYDNPKEFFKL